LLGSLPAVTLCLWGHKRSKDNELRDSEIKLGLYSRYGVKQYWQIDWRARFIEVYRADQGQLIHAGTLSKEGKLETPLLPNFSCDLETLFAGIPATLAE